MPTKSQTPFSFYVLTICSSKLRACRKGLCGKALLPCLGPPTLPGLPLPSAYPRVVHKSSFQSPQGLARPPWTSVPSQWKQLKTTWQKRWGDLMFYSKNTFFSHSYSSSGVKPAALPALSGWYPRVPDSFLLCLRSPGSGEARLLGSLWPPRRSWSSRSSLTFLTRLAALVPSEVRLWPQGPVRRPIFGAWGMWALAGGLEKNGRVLRVNSTGL